MNVAGVNGELQRIILAETRLAMTWTQFIFFINLLTFLCSAAHDVTASSAADVARTSPMPEALCEYRQ